MPALNDIPSADKKEQILSSVNALFEESVRDHQKAKETQRKLNDELNTLKTKKEQSRRPRVSFQGLSRLQNEDRGKIKGERLPMMWK